MRPETVVELEVLRERVFGFADRVVEVVPAAPASGDMLGHPGVHLRSDGTRVLLDYHLDQLGLSADHINGYHQEEYTHLGVAAAVASGRATCGLVIAAAAQALDLDFIPLFQERYDLVFPQEYANSPLLAPLFDLLAASSFRTAVSGLAGYDTSMTGTIVLDDPF